MLERTEEELILAVGDAVREALAGSSWFVTRWLVIAEVADGDDHSAFLVAADASGEELPAWQESGLLFEALHNRADFVQADDEASES